ncbi:MAG: oligosaccharide flippase family protein, partial [Candidatus Eremiobacteraeota bacterium]|nr:oligosaccharide flippase family protein [Candidatus Eremiobacteraeota bacterium]
PYERVRVGEYARYAWNIGLVNLVSLLNYRVDVYIVAVFASARALGLYAIAVSGAESLQVFTQVASIVTAPHIGSLDTPSAARLTARAMRGNVVLAAAIAAIVFVLAPFVVRALYGTAYLDMVPAFRILLVGIVAFSSASIVSSFFTLRLGNPLLSLRVAGAAAAVCAVVSVILVPRVGIVGAAIGTVAGYLLGQAVMLAIFCRTSGIPVARTVLLTGDDVRSLRRLVMAFLGTKPTEHRVSEV